VFIYIEVYVERVEASVMYGVCVVGTMPTKERLLCI